MSARFFVRHLSWIFASTCGPLACGTQEVQQVRCYQPGPSAAADAGADAAGSDSGTSPDARSLCRPAGAAASVLADPAFEKIAVDEGPVLQPDGNGGLLCCYLVTVSEGTFGFGP
jgi:hypothetical protein